MEHNLLDAHLDPWSTVLDLILAKLYRLGMIFLPNTDKKEKKIFLVYKEIQKGTVAKSCMRKGFLIYENMRKYLVIYEG